jgi:Fe-S-cluster containining protein
MQTLCNILALTIYGFQVLLEQECCTEFASPLVFENDLINLKHINKHTAEFVKDITINGKKIKTIRKKIATNNCVFWDEYSSKCLIYKNRPFDCALYQFDIHFIDGKYYWIVYTCNPASDGVGQKNT